MELLEEKEREIERKKKKRKEKRKTTGNGKIDKKYRNKELRSQDSKHLYLPTNLGADTRRTYSRLM